LIFLDELTTGLDPQARHVIWELVSELRSQGKTVLLSTHFMEEAEYLCDRVAILDHGRLVALDSPAALIRSLGGEQRVHFSLEASPSPALKEALSRLGRCELHGQQVTIHGKDDLVSQVVSLLSAQGFPFLDLRTEQPNLEDVFLSLTGRALRE
jgi:ABC-2 type transport system ATP-binding protein